MAEILTGPDCSRHQGTVDWGKVKNQGGHDFGICKLTDGLAYGYTSWGLENIPKVRNAGLVPGAYHWLDAGPQGQLHSPELQAVTFVQHLERVGGPNGIVCALDVELERGSGGKVISMPKIDSVRIFADRFFRLTDNHPLLVYSGQWYWKLIGNPNASDIGPLWHAEYELSVGEYLDGPELYRYGNWIYPKFWQFTSNDVGLGVDVPGVSTLCDLNRFFGSRSELLSLTHPDQPINIPSTPGSLKEDDDVFLFSRVNPGKPVFFVGGGKAVGLNSANDLAAFPGVPHFKLDDATYDAFVETYR